MNFIKQKEVNDSPTYIFLLEQQLNFVKFESFVST